MAGNVTQSDQTQKLGALKNSYTPRILPGRAMLGTAVFCALFSIFEFITAINKLNTPPSEILSDRFRQDAIMIAFVLGAFFLFFTLLMVGLYYAHIKHRVDVYQHGLLIYTWRGSIMFPWEEISEMKAEPIYGSTNEVINWTITLVRGDRQKARLRGLNGLQSIKNQIERKARNLL